MAARRSSQSILTEISLKCSLEGLILKVKLYYFGHLMQRADSLGKILMLGKIESRKRKRQQRMRWLVEDETVNRHESEQPLGVGDGHEAWCAAIHGVTMSWT